MNVKKIINEITRMIIILFFILIGCAILTSIALFVIHIDRIYLIYIMLSSVMIVGVIGYKIDVKTDFTNKFKLFETVVFVDDESTKKINDLKNESVKIRQTLDNIDNLTINELKTIFQRILDFVDALKQETINQEKIVNTLRERVRDEREKTNYTVNQAEKLTSLSTEQINAIKILITKDVKNDNRKNFILGLLLSFIIGVIASIFANSIM